MDIYVLYTNTTIAGMSPSAFKKYYIESPRGAQVHLRYNMHIIESIRFELNINYELENNAIIYMLINDMQEKPLCNICNKNLRKFKGISKGGFSDVCNNAECKYTYRSVVNKKSAKKIDWEASIKKAQDTSVKNTGYKSNLSAGSPGRELVKNRMNEIYGVDHPLQNKDILNKAQETMIKNHGTLNMICSEKTKQTNIERYGFDNAMKNADVRKKLSDKSSILKWEILCKNSIDKCSLVPSYMSHTSDMWLDVDCLLCKNKTTKVHRVALNRAIYIEETLCRVCAPIKNTFRSNGEHEVYEFIKSFYNKEVQRNRRYVTDGIEIDILIPDIKLGIEYNGVYWHSEIHKDNNYHRNKKKAIDCAGWDLIQIWEDDWKDPVKSAIIKSRLKSKLNYSDTVIYARKCEIKNVSPGDAKTFLVNNHIQGFTPSKIKYGLYYENTLVMITTFGKPRTFISGNRPECDWELLRMCSKLNTNIIGGFSRLLTHFKRNNIGTILSYADCDWVSLHDNAYVKNGFEEIKWTTPGYWWVVGGIRMHRYNFTRFKITDILEEQTVDEYMYDKKCYKICGSGNILYTM